MGGTCTKVTDASLGGRDTMRTRAAQFQVEKYMRLLRTIPIDGTIVFASMNEEYQRLRSDAFSFVDCGYPLAIFRPHNALDIAVFLRSISHLKLNISIAGGKHSAVCLQDHCIVIDLHFLSDIMVNAQEKWIDIGGGAKLGAADSELRGTALGFISSTHPDVGVGGFTQSGGWGWLSRHYGLAVDHWIEAQVVLADGTIVVANDTNEHSELMRALRGGAGNFGIVTRFRFALHNIESCHYAMPIRFCPSKSSARATAKAFRDRMDIAPSYASGMIIFPCGKPLLPTIISAIGANDDIPDTHWIEDIVQSKSGQWLSYRTEIMEDNYHFGLQMILEPLTKRGYTMTASHFVKDLSDGVINVILEYTRSQHPGRQSFITAACWGGEIPNENPQRPHAVSHCENGWWLLIHAILPDLSWYQIIKHKRWVLALKAALQEVDSTTIQGTHVFFDNLSRTQAFDEVTHLFLRQVKTDYFCIGDTIYSSTQLMGNLWTKPTEASLAGRDSSRTRSAMLLVEKYGQILQSIRIDGRLIFASMNEEYQRIRSSAFSFPDCGYPFAIFLPLHSYDIANILRTIAPLKLEIAIASGKHSPLAFPDNAVVIDLHYLSDVSINVDERWIDVAGGAKLGSVDAELHGTGLGFISGTHPDVGVGGFTQCGGWGWLSRRHGLAADHWLEAEVVLANGEIVTANDNNEHNQLMRALRGGAGNFGVVTRYRFALHDIENCFYSTPSRHCPTTASAKRTAKAFRDRMDVAPPYASGMLVFPCGQPKVTQILTAIGSAAEVPDASWIRAMQRMKGGQWATTSTKIYEDDYHLGLQTMFQSAVQRGYSMTSSWFIRDLSDQVIDIILSYTRKKYPGTQSLVMAACWGANIPDGFAERPHVLTHRENGWWILIQAIVPDMSLYQVTKHKQWVHDLKAALQEADNGAKQGPHVFFDVNFRNAAMTTAVYDDITGLFLQQIKTEYDPMNIFHMNHNIPPLV
ncbi:hypothetical protein THRCLA_08858 [Thraustotheca clavata]|uniref:FAD-binding PCMH-type domain-containing protein n=1 Tax=Thraustotheca clavata TaxID=74557 RepID=A0A1V9Z1M9_9STRA|nr:hypothetical protein THRCLA_08858 [Thraustotheca clavata]